MRHKLNFRFCPNKFIIILVFLISSCKKQDEIAIGENFEGGIIFYIDNTGQHGLVAAPYDQGDYQWGCVTTMISGADGSEVGTGNQNTIDIVNGCPETNTAAYICANLELNNYSDWFLPSKAELSLMYKNLKTRNLGDFKTIFKFLGYESEVLYWSSTESKELSAWNQSFKDGRQNDGFSKNNGGYVRAIRAY